MTIALYIYFIGVFFAYIMHLRFEYFLSNFFGQKFNNWQFLIGLWFALFSWLSVTAIIMAFRRM